MIFLNLRVSMREEKLNYYIIIIIIIIIIMIIIIIIVIIMTSYLASSHALHGSARGGAAIGLSSSQIL